MNPAMILKIIIILLQLIANGINKDTAISDVASRYNVSASFLRKFL